MLGIKRKFIVISLCIGLLLVIFAHLVGYKIFGSPMLYENQPLGRPMKLANINEQDEIILANNSHYRIYGINTIIAEPLSQLKYFQRQMPTLEVEIANPDKPISKVWHKHRINYWCGNTWMPRFFPGRLNKFSKVDLGETLVLEGAAIPTVEVFQEEPDYAKQLMHALKRTVSKLDIQQNEDHAINLGWFLIDSGKEYFNSGAWLVAHRGEQEISDIVKCRIEDLMEIGFAGYRERADFRADIIDLLSILIKASPDDAKEVGHKIIDGYNNEYPYLEVRVALKLLGIDDWYGLDSLMSKIVDSKLDTAYRHSIVFTLENPLISCWQRGGNRFNESSKDYRARMAQWYQDNKSKLIWNEKQQQMTFRTDDKSKSQKR